MERRVAPVFQTDKLTRVY